jgi:tRNA pseudouridine55 synthase
MDPPTRPFVASDLDGAIAPLLGEVDQMPPALSAIRVDGERLWQKFRRGETVDVPTRRVRIDSIEVLDFTWPEAQLRVRCGSGTYIRSIARDLGESLGTGAYLTSLRRDVIGTLNVVAAPSPEAATLDDLISLEHIFAEAPRFEIDPADLPIFLHGRTVPHVGADLNEALAFCNGQLIARARRSPDGVRMKRQIVE